MSRFCRWNRGTAAHSANLAAGYANFAGLCCQTLQDLLAELLRFAEKFLVFEEDAAHLQRLVNREIAAEHHVAHVDGIRQGRVFVQFFKSGRGIVVVHDDDSTATAISQASSVASSAAARFQGCLAQQNGQPFFGVDPMEHGFDRGGCLWRVRARTFRICRRAVLHQPFFVSLEQAGQR
jgi:hypothetical protein